MIDWWKERLKNDCRIDLCNGLFVDQHWINFVPIFYKDSVLIENIPAIMLLIGIFMKGKSPKKAILFK